MLKLTGKPSSAPRILPVKGDGMSPTLKTGEAVLIIPGADYDAPALYVLEMLGEPVIYRVDYWMGTVRCRLDNPVYQGFDTTLEDFRDMLLGRVVGTFRDIDFGAIELLTAKGESNGRKI